MCPLFTQRPKMVTVEVRIPRQLVQRIELLRAKTGIPKSEWMRTQLQIAADLELSRHPGAFWLRPGARIYRMEVGTERMDIIPIPITVSQGGERVWVMEILPDLNVGEGDEGLGKDEKEGAMLCDLSADEEGQVELRRVLVAVADVLPTAVAYTTGIGAFKHRKEREKRRREAESMMRKDAN